MPAFIANRGLILTHRYFLLINIEREYSMDWNRSRQTFMDITYGISFVYFFSFGTVPLMRSNKLYIHYGYKLSWYFFLYFSVNSWSTWKSTPIPPIQFGLLWFFVSFLVLLYFEHFSGPWYGCQIYVYVYTADKWTTIWPQIWYALLANIELKKTLSPFQNLWLTASKVSI